MMWHSSIGISVAVVRADETQVADLIDVKGHMIAVRPFVRAGDGRMDERIRQTRRCV